MLRLPSESCIVHRVSFDGHTAIQKRFPSHRGYAQERHALRHLYPERILADHSGTRTLILVDLPGIAAPASPKVHEEAGRWLRWLHDQPASDQDPLPLDDALRKRGEALNTRVPVQVNPRPRVWCHRDFRPANWLWDGETLRVIDFEHARLDHPLWDLVKLSIHIWPHAPHLYEAFQRTYGPWDAGDLSQLQRLFQAQTLERSSL